MTTPYKHFEGKKWEELTLEEQQEWNKLYNEHKEAFNPWVRMCLVEKCPMCRGFNEPLIKKLPGNDTIPLLDRINVKFLVHTKVTHGLPPTALLGFFGLDIDIW